VRASDAAVSRRQNKANVLQETGYLGQKLSDDPTADEYLLYLGACWAIANEYDVSLRTLDRALWVLDIKKKVPPAIKFSQE